LNQLLIYADVYKRTQSIS